MAVAVHFTELRAELEKAKENLKYVDDNIKKVTGRDPSEFRTFQANRRQSTGGLQQDRISGRMTGFNAGRRDVADGGPPLKRRTMSTFSRLGPRMDKRRSKDEDSGDDDDVPSKVTVQSSVVANPKEQKTRKDCIEEQKTDEKGMARNRRMFGLLLGTLQKFRVEEQQKKGKEQKRIEIEKKLDDIAEKEKEDMKKERRELFLERRKRQAELRRLEYKMELVKQLEEWEKHHKTFMNFISTKTKPALYYLPAKHNDASKQRLADSQKIVEAHLSSLRASVEEEISSIGKRKEVVNENEDEGEYEMNAKEGEELDKLDGDMSVGEVQQMELTSVTTEQVEQEVDMNIPYEEVKENYPTLISAAETVADSRGEQQEQESLVVSHSMETYEDNSVPEKLQEGLATVEETSGQNDNNIPPAAEPVVEMQTVEERDNDLDAIDPNRLTEKEFEPIYD